MACIVYVTTNLVNGKKYLGKHNGTISAYFGSGTLLKKAIHKYGKNSFLRTTIAECATDQEAYDLEERLSRQWNVVSDPNWYNLRCGGEGSCSGSDHPDYGTTHSLARRLANSEAQKNSTAGRRHIQNLIALHTGKINSDEYKRKMSDSCRKSEKVQTHNKRLNEQLTSERRREITLRTMAARPELLDRLRETRNNRKGVPQTIEHINKRISALRGRKCSIITCPHCSISGGNSVMRRWHFDNCKRK